MENNFFNDIILCFIGFIGIFLLFLYLPITIKRLHDLNFNGWWSLVFFLPFGQIVLLPLLFYKGTPGPNKYGEQPE